MDEQPVDIEHILNEYESKIKGIGDKLNEEDKSKNPEYLQLLKEQDKLLDQFFSNITPKQTLWVARHKNRPQTKDYIQNLFTEFVELKGDRMKYDDPAIVAGFGSLEGKTYFLVGQHKGKTTTERMHHKFGMSRPEGYEKAIRIMKLAEKFNKPVIAFVDTPGASPLPVAEENCQAWKIAKNIYEMMELKVPLISVIIGEGGSGGAMAIDVSNRRLMLKYSYYSVISPEGCAGILYREANPKTIALCAESLKITSDELFKRKIIDEIIKEPKHGAHTNYAETFSNVKDALLRHLKDYENMTAEQIKSDRESRYRNIGEYKIIG